MPTIERAGVLREHHRYEEAAKELLGVLAEDPDNAHAHAELALAQLNIPGEQKHALESIDKAISSEADNGEFLSLKSLVLSDLDKNKEALNWAEMAISIDPSAFAWLAKAHALTNLRQWAKSEEACNETLKQEPDNAYAQNIKTFVLRMQGKLTESEKTLTNRLERDAEDPLAFANSGWATLQRGDQKKAEGIFRESLRLEPENEYARQGLLEAYKARSLFYRLYLKWVFFLQKFGRGTQILFFLGIYAAFNFGRRLLSLSPLLSGCLLFVYFFFVFGSFIAPGIGHFLLLKDPLVRLSLRKEERLDGFFVGLSCLLGLLFLALGLTILPRGVGFFGGCLLAASIPLSLVFCNGSKIGKAIFGGISLFVISTGFFFLWNALSGRDTLADPASLLLPIAILATIGATWLSLIPALSNRLPEE